jgi:hypothetical protein
VVERECLLRTRAGPTCRGAVGRGNSNGFGSDLLLQVVDCGVELGVLALIGGVGEVVDDDIGVYAMAFDQPFTFGAVYAGLGGAGDAVVDEDIVP